ncbi:MAG: hypothetical protein HQL47_11275 [Gammaproteobacteria bacterium]|nr:hypothetical protein [Gammaproteobacteria bacterium]
MLKLIFMVLLLGLNSALAAAPVAMVTDLQGSVTRDGQPLALLAELDAGAQLQLAADSQLTLVLYRSGEEFRLQGAGQASLTESAVLLDGKPLAGAALLLSAEGAKLSSAQLSQAAILMRSAVQKDRLIELSYPVSSVILEPRPVFSWRIQGDSEKAYSYRLEVLSEKGKSLFVGSSDIGRLRLPKGVELPRGERLTWELEAKKDGKMTLASADFRIASDELVDRVDQLSAQVGEDFARRVMFARFLQANSLKHDAANYWKGLAEEHPERQELRAQIKSGN